MPPAVLVASLGLGAGFRAATTLDQDQKVWQPPRAARSNRPNTPSDGSKTQWVPYHQAEMDTRQVFTHLEDFNEAASPLIGLQLSGSKIKGT